MSGSRLRRLREERGLTQTDLADRAGVSRQLVGALEAGRHLPRVDAALGLASALGVDVALLFGRVEAVVDVLSGETPADGALVRLGRVGERTVLSPARAGASGWDAADAVVEGEDIRRFGPINPGVVMAGCEPGLEVLEQTLRESGRGALAVTCSTAAAIRSLNAGRAHIAVVHGTPDQVDEVDSDETIRFHLCAWQVGLAGPDDGSLEWAEEALGGRVAVAQRESGAGVQRAFERATGRRVGGPLVGGHLEAARLAVTSGIPAVTIEPTAIALGAGFHPLETHRAELLVSRQWIGDSGVEAVMNEIVGERFQRRLSGVGGYDLSGIGVRAA